MDRSVKIKRIDTEPKGRTIAISDIHADYASYIKLLKEVEYQANMDRLIIVGDFLEKGNDNLKLLHFFMKQSEKEDIHLLMGNCDFVCKNVLYSYRLNFLKRVLLSRKESILHEMAQQIHFSFNEDTDMDVFCSQLRKHFLKELSFVNDLPHVIETDSTIYVHSALQSSSHYGDDFREVINHSFFAKEEQYFPKRVVCGHMPVTEYCHRIGDFNPYYNAKMNVYSIDGGNVVKGKIGQLNALILSGHQVEVASVDQLPLIKVKKSQNEINQLPFFINWNQGDVEIRQEKKKQYLVYNTYLNREFWLPKEFYKDGKASEYTNYQIPLKEGEYVKLLRVYQDKAQVKKNGQIGWTYLDHLDKESV